MVSRGCRNTSLDSGGCVDIIASGQEGAGASTAIGQASTVHGVAGSRVERARRGPRSRRLPVSSNELGTWVHDLPQRRRRRFRSALGSVGGPPDQPAILIRGRTDQDRRSSSFRAEYARDRRRTWLGEPLRRFRASCAATRRPDPSTSPSRLIGAPLRVEHVITDVGSRPMSTSAPWSPNCSVTGGARSRSAGTFVCAFPPIRRCGCVMRVSIKLSTNRIRDSCARRGWHLTAVHRCAPDGTTAERTNVRSVGGRGFSSRC